MFHADGRTDGWTNMTKLIAGFRNFANAPKNIKVIQITFIIDATTVRRIVSEEV